jgi:hypothetical protein
LISNSTAWRLNSSLYTLFLFLSDIGFLLFSLGSRVRQIGAVSPYLIASDSIVPGEYQGHQNIENLHKSTTLSFVGEIAIELSDQLAYRKRPGAGQDQGGKTSEI